MVPRIKEHDLGAGRLRNYFFRCRVQRAAASVFAIEESLPPEYKRSGEIEGMGCWVKDPIEDMHIGLVATDASEVDPVSVTRIRRIVGKVEPGWVEAVRRAARQTNVLEEIAEESGVYELNAVAAIVGELVAGGELPPLEIGDLGEE